MQGKLIIAIAIAAFGADAAICGETIRRQPCQKAEQPQQRQQSAQQVKSQQRQQPRGCPVPRNIPPVVDPTPTFVL